MSLLFRPFLLLIFPVLLFGCEESPFGPKKTACLETSLVTSSGASTEKVYEENKIKEIRYLQNNVLQSSYAFTYGADGRISTSQYYNSQYTTQDPPQEVTYNAQGKWIKLLLTVASGNSYYYEAEYNEQNQIKKLTYSTNRSGTVTVNYTIAYEWEGGNQTGYTYNAPTSRQVLRYEFDLEQENKQRKEQEALAFLSNSVAYNQNMVKRVVSTVTNLTTGVTTETINLYSYQYNDKGFPTQLTRTSTTDTAAPTVITTDYEYTCD